MKNVSINQTNKLIKKSINYMSINLQQKLSRMYKKNFNKIYYIPQ